MKSRNVYILALVVTFVVMLLMELNMPQRFNWEPTFAPHDKQPLGCYVFDSIVAQSLPQGYSVRNTTFYQLNDSVANENCNYLFVLRNSYLDDEEIDNLLNLLRKGHSVALISEHFSEELEEAIGIYTKVLPYVSTDELRESMVTDTLYWLKDTLYKKKAFGMAAFTFHNLAFSQQMAREWTAHVVDELDGLHNVFVASRRFGKGRLVVCTTPYLFTNYGILDDTASQYVARVLSLLYNDVPQKARRAPLVRVISYQTEVQQTEEASPLRYFMKSPPLRWSIYLALVTIVLFMLFTARRRQRAIPVVKPLRNQQVEFAQLIGTLYYQRADHTELLRKKYTYFAEHLRRVLLVDINNPDEDASSFSRIAMQTGMPQQQVSAEIKQMRKVATSDDAVITEDILHMMIEEMEKINSLL